MVPVIMAVMFLSTCIRDPLAMSVLWVYVWAGLGNLHPSLVIVPNSLWSQEMLLGWLVITTSAV